MAALVAAVALLMTGCGGGNATDGDGAPPAEEATAEPTPTVRIVVPDRAKALGAGGMPGPAGR
jgi:hypothetical protein